MLGMAIGFGLVGAIVGWAAARAWVGWKCKAEPNASSEWASRIIGPSLLEDLKASRLPVREEPAGRRAFLYAYETLLWLKAEGVTASARLYPDGSGGLCLSPVERMVLTPALRMELETRLHSARWSNEGGNDVILSSCQGWHPDD